MLKTKLTLGLSLLTMLDVRKMLTELYELIEQQDKQIKELTNEVRELSKDRSRPNKGTGAIVSPSTVRP